MSFTIAGREGSFASLDLRAAVNMTVPTTAWGVIPHDEVILSMSQNSLIWVVRLARRDLDLLVDTYCLTSVGPAEPLLTRVFNLSTQPVRIKAGTILSRLVSVRLE